MSNEMTKRFCGMVSYPIEFPLEHPQVVLPDFEFEEKISNIILYPQGFRIKNRINKMLKGVLGISDDDSLSGTLRKCVSSMKKI